MKNRKTENKGIGKRFLAVALSAVLLLSLAACGSSEGADTDTGENAAESTGESVKEDVKKGDGFTIWVNALSASATGEYVEYLKAFPEEHPEWNAEVTIVSGEDIKTQVRMAVESGTAPDAMLVYSGEDFAELLDKGAAKDLTSIIKENGFDAYADAGYFDSFTQDGRIYGMPVGGVTVWQTLYVNNDIFKEYGLAYPTTVEELQEVCSKLREEGVEPLALGDKDGWPALLLLGDLYLQQTDFSSVEKLNSGEVKFAEDPYMRKALEALEAMGSDNVFMSGFTSSDQTMAIQSWASGQVAMLYNGSWWTGPAGGTELGFEIVPVKLPLVEGISEPNTVQMACDNALIFNPECTNEEAIVSFLEYFCREEAQVLYCSEANVFSIYPGANEKVTLDPIFTQPAILDQFQYPASGIFFDHAFPSAVIEVMKTAVQNVVTGQTSVDEALQQMDEEMSRSLE